MRVTITTGNTRQKPRTGDRRVIAGAEHVRIPQRVEHGPYRGAHIVNNGRPCFEWIPVSEAAASGYGWLVKQGGV